MSDSQSNERDPYLLCELFLSGSMTSEEAESLYAMLLNNQKVADCFRQNVLVDFLLREESELERRSREAKNGLSDAASQWDAVSNDQCFSPWCETSAATIITVPSFLPPEKKSFWASYFSPKEERTDNTDITVHAKRPPAQERKEPSRIPLVVTTITLICLACAFMVDHFRHSHRASDNGSTVAKVVDTIDVVWNDGNFPFRRGQETGPNKFSLKSGMVKLEFPGPTELILKGPGEYTVNSKKDVFCSYGSLSARVNDKNSGFGITTPAATIIDRGTEFFVEVANGRAHVGVVSGQVDLLPHQPASSTQKVMSLSQGKAMVSDMNGNPHEITFDPKSFISGSKFREFLTHYMLREKEKRSNAFQLLDAKPGMLARFDFTQGDNYSVPNQSPGRELCRNAQIHGCTTDEGQFEGTQSIKFGKSKSRVEFVLPGEYESLTLLANVRIRALSNWGSILFAAGDSMEHEGAFLWQITREGEIHLLFKPKGEKINAPFRTGPVFTRQSWGGWYRLAVVLDSKNKTITHYVDGEQVASFPWQDALPLRPYLGTIGNASRSDKSVLNRFLDGNMETFIILGEVLTPEEIAQFK